MMNEAVSLASHPWLIFVLVVIFPGSLFFAGLYCVLNGDKVFGIPEKKRPKSTS